MRVLAPFLVVATLTVLGNGVALIVANRHDRGELLFAHKVSFVIWLVLAGVHVLAYSLGLPRLVRAGLRRQPSTGRSVAATSEPSTMGGR